MATAPRIKAPRKVDYPTGDGKPMAETELHLWVAINLIQILANRYATDPMVYVGANLLMFYEEGNKRKHLSPDIFVVRGVDKLPPRENYLIWEEGKGPDVVIEVTSKSTKDEDEVGKRQLYQNVLKVPEYFQFDPTEDYLRPSLKGAKLRNGVYHPIAAINGRLPSEQLGLHLEREGTALRLYDPAIGERLLTPSERAEAEIARAAEESTRAAVASIRANSAEAENARLRRELDELRRRLEGGS